MSIWMKNVQIETFGVILKSETNQQFLVYKINIVEI